MVNKPMVLIVDANPETSSELTSILNDSYQVILAQSREEAERLYKDLHLKVRLVLVNSQLPETALAVLLRDLKRFSSVPDFVVFSENENIQDAVSAIKHGAVAYLTTPFFKDSLLQTLENALEEYDIFSKLEDVSHHKHTFDHSELEQLFSKAKSMVEAKQLDLSDRDYDILTDVMNSFHPEARPQSQKRASVLLVEDEPMYQSTLQKFLEKQFDVQVASTGKEALDAIHHDGEFDVVLLDVFLPDTSGTELLPQIKSLSPKTQVIIVTAFEFLEIAVQTLRNGACDYLNKPFMKDDLIASVERAYHLKYQQYDLPLIIRQRIDQEMSQDGKLTLLNLLSKERPENSQHLYMEDVYLFFPALRKSCIPDASPVPYKVTETNNLSGFISSLIQSEISRSQV